MKSCQRVQSAVTSSRKQRHDFNSDDFLKSLKCSWAPDFKPQVKHIHLESLQIRWSVYLQIQSEYITGPISYFLVDQSGRWGQSFNQSQAVFKNQITERIRFVQLPSLLLWIPFLLLFISSYLTPNVFSGLILRRAWSQAIPFLLFLKMIPLWNIPSWYLKVMGRLKGKGASSPSATP